MVIRDEVSLRLISATSKMFQNRSKRQFNQPLSRLVRDCGIALIYWLRPPSRSTERFQKTRQRAYRSAGTQSHPPGAGRAAKSVGGKSASSKGDLISTLMVSNSISQKTCTAKQWDESHALFSKTPPSEEHIDKRKLADRLESIHHKVFEELDWDLL